MDKHNIVVIGASAGGLEAIIQLFRQLPSVLHAAVFIVLHTAPSSPGLLPKILQRYTHLQTVFPRQDEEIVPGTVYIAPPNRHLIIHRHHIEVSSGPRVNMLRPAADVLFRSAAIAFGPKVVGIVLSGTRNDGTNGLQEIQRHGGVTIIQDPEEALFPGMPESAQQNLKVDYVLKISEMAELLAQLAQPVENQTMKIQVKPMSNDIQKENKIIQHDKVEFEEIPNQSEKTILTCPECGGVLWEMHEGGLIRYVCHVGHAFSEGSLTDGQDMTLEKALWVAVRTLEERAALVTRLANRAKRQGNELAQARFNDQAEDARKNADIIRAILMNPKPDDSISEF